MNPETLSESEGFGGKWSFSSGTYLLPMVGRDEEFEIWKKNLCRKNVELIGRLDGWVQGDLKNRLQQSKIITF